MTDNGLDVADSLNQAADAERTLLKRERRAERDLDVARLKLDEAVERLRSAESKAERRRDEVKDAQARLQRRQDARAAGPSAGDEAVNTEQAPTAANTGKSGAAPAPGRTASRSSSGGRKRGAATRAPTKPPSTVKPTPAEKATAG